MGFLSYFSIFNQNICYYQKEKDFSQKINEINTIEIRRKLDCIPLSFTQYSMDWTFYVTKCSKLTRLKKLFIWFLT